MAGAMDARERIGTREGVELYVLGRFLRAMLLNLVKDPEKEKALEKMDLAVSFEPRRRPDQSVTLLFDRGRVLLENGVSTRPDISIAGEVSMLIRLSRVPFGPRAIGYLRTWEGKSLVAAVLSRDLRIRGAVRHPLRMARFARLMSPPAG